MVALRFSCVDAGPDPYAAGPTLRLQLQVTESTGVRVQAIALRCQIRIEPRKRQYSPSEAGKLGDLFGDRSRWGKTLNPIQLATVAAMVPSFTDEITVPLDVPMTYDTEIASTKYLAGLEDGETPLLLLFSGTAFTAGTNGMQVHPVPWYEEAEYRLPVSVWRASIDVHFPGTAWVRMRRETLEALSAWRSAKAIPSWDETFELLLKEADG